ncbi:MAG: hypothetical protein KIT80_12845 [Chitinophagaceae bacterium]|nr:hypothetical protein [Chitinophagaceae bacterium]MCW5927793.1 hypothetical protein [Chitinophagaceae bacterium]
MKTLLTAILFLGVGTLYAQTGSAKMVTWSFASKKINDNTYELRIKAGLNGRYHMYAQDVGVEGPVPTTFSFSANPMVTLEGKVKELGKLIQKHEAVWDGKVNYFEKEVEFVQVVKLKKNIKTSISGSVEFMVCDDKECLPPSEVPFKIALGS